MSFRSYWLRGLDLNQRPLGYELSKYRIFNELESVVGSFKECYRAVKTFRAMVFGVGLGLEMPAAAEVELSLLLGILSLQGRDPRV